METATLMRSIVVSVGRTRTRPMPIEPGASGRSAGRREMAPIGPVRLGFTFRKQLEQAIANVNLGRGTGQ